MSMYGPTFSVLHASYGRPGKAVAAMRMAMDRSSVVRRIESVEYIFALNSDDPSSLEYADLDLPSCVKVVLGRYNGSAPAWDAAANASTGSIMVQMSDDLELPAAWDEMLVEALLSVKSHPNPWYAPLFIAVSDGYRKDGLCTSAIMTRERYKQCGEFLHAGYRSVYSDDDVTYRAKRDARDGKSYFVDARHITFLHRHHYHDPSVAMDSTYARGNDPEAYRIGAALFAERNPEAATDGLRTWS